MLTELKKKVLQANLELVKNGLVICTWGNVSGIDRDIAIKPSGVAYEQMKIKDIVIVDIEGRIVDGTLNPSSDTPTHLALYRAFHDVMGITHTHSTCATIFAQACCEIPCLGTTHADYFSNAVPVTRYLNQEEVESDYEANTGKIIIERFKNIDPMEIPAVLVAGHAPFTWGSSPEKSVENSVVLEYIAKMALETIRLNPEIKPLPEYILQKHYLRKHGKKAYYGQKGNHS